MTRFVMQARKGTGQPKSPSRGIALLACGGGVLLRGIRQVPARRCLVHFQALLEKYE